MKRGRRPHRQRVLAPTAPRPEQDVPPAAALMYRLGTVARLIDTPAETVRSWIRRGTVRAVHVGRSVYVTRAELERLVAHLEAESCRPSPRSPAATATVAAPPEQENAPRPLGTARRAKGAEGASDTVDSRTVYAQRAR